jgi:hypothetical protein
MEHCKEIFWILPEASRVLKIGGSLIIGVPNLGAAHTRFLLLLGLRPSCIKSASAHIRGFTKHEMIDFMRCGFPNGYAPCDFGGSNFYPFSPSLASQLAMAFPSLATSIFFRFKKLAPYDGGFLRFPVEHRLETNFWIGRH